MIFIPSISSLPELMKVRRKRPERWESRLCCWQVTSFLPAQVKEITKILFDSKEKIQYALPVDISLDETTAVEGITIPFHKGAAAYYEDCSVDLEDETEKGSK